MAAPSRRGHLVFLVLSWMVVAAVVFAPTSAQATDLEAGVMGGGNWNLLTQPTDPAGSYTFLWGSAFSGFGTVWGATMSMKLRDFDGARLSVTSDVLHGYHRGLGYADHGELGRVDVLLSTHVLRFPVMLRISNPESEGPTLGIGLEPIVGLSTDARVSQTGVDGPIEDVDTVSTTSMAGLLALGLEFETDGGQVVPIDLRLAWNPFVESSTEHRFENFQGRDSPGAYRVIFDWQVMATAGLRWAVGE